MGAWWRGTALVAERGMVENVRSRTFKVVTAMLLVLSAAAVILPQLLRSDETTYTLATTDYLYLGGDGFKLHEADKAPTQTKVSWQSALIEYGLPSLRQPEPSSSRNDGERS